MGMGGKAPGEGVSAVGIKKQLEKGERGKESAACRRKREAERSLQRRRPYCHEEDGRMQNLAVTRERRQPQRRKRTRTSGKFLAIGC